MDPRTAKVAIELQLEDIDVLLRSLTTSNDVVSINERAGLEIVQRDLVQQLTELENHILVTNILSDEHREHVAFQKLLDEEKNMSSDHQLATRLAGLSLTEKGTVPFPLDTPYTIEENAQWKMAKELYASAFDQDNSNSAPDGHPESPVVADRASQHVVRTTTADEKNNETMSSKNLIKCDACMEAKPTKNSLSLHCTHTYCRTCLLDLFTSTI